ncbi:hypothetical protein HYV43_04845 [Candidatus Micrarchaeota archaeon]|nr:hypothetical protein [Candidatus Micrarchaeota archaeon]
MKIPNPYENPHYKKLLVVPAVLIAISLGLIFFGPGIKPGIDFKGGLLITIQSTSGIDSAALSAAIERVAGEKPALRVFESPAGSGVEIELPLKAQLDQADEQLATVHSLQEQYDRARIALSQGQGSQSATDALGRQLLDAAAATVKTASGSSLSTTEPTAAVIEAENAVADARSAYRQALLDAVNSAVTADSVLVREVGSSLSGFFFSKLQQVVLISLVLLALIVFIMFRSIGPSLAVMIGPLTDVIIAAGAMSLFQIPWNLASIAAMLMLVGFSLDSYTMLTVRILKRTQEGTGPERAFDATKTAFLMNAAQITGFGVLAAIAMVLQVPTYYQIGIVATIGGLTDFVTTWFGNAPLLLWMSERKRRNAQ